MTTYTNIARLPLPENTDALVAQNTIGDFAAAIDSQIIPQYTTTAARDSAMASGKAAGQLCAVAGELMWWDGSAWWGTQDLRIVNKTALTSRASTTVLADDPHLTTTIKAGGTYLIEAWLYYTCPATTVNVSGAWRLTGTTNVKGRFVGGGAANEASPNSSNVTFCSSGSTTAISTSSSATTSGVTRNEYLLVSCTADETVTWQWAQGTSSASALVLVAGSHLVIRRIT